MNLLHSAIYLIFVCSMLAISMPSAQADTTNMTEQLEQLQRGIAKGTVKLDAATDWIVQHGGREYTQNHNDYRSFYNFLNKNFGVSIVSEPLFESQDILARFTIFFPGVFYDIISLWAVEADGMLYEYWVTKIWGKEWSGVEESCIFYVTKAKDLFSDKEVVRKELTFLPNIETEGGSVFEFPLDDLQRLYVLAPWRYPECYPDHTELTENPVIISDDLEYVYAHKPLRSD